MEVDKMLLETVLEKLSSLDEKMDDLTTRVTNIQVDHEHRLTDIERRLNNGLSETQRKHGEMLDAMHKRLDKVEEQIIAHSAKEELLTKQLTEEIFKLQKVVGAFEDTITGVADDNNQKWTTAYAAIIVLLISIVGFLFIEGPNLHIIKSDDDDKVQQRVEELWKNYKPLPSQPSSSLQR